MEADQQIASLAPLVITLLTAASTFGTALAVVIAAVMQKLDALKAAEQLQADKKELKASVETAEQKAGDQAKDVTKKLTVIHDLVNSGMLAQMKVSAVALRQVANLTIDPVAKLAAEGIATEAERLFKEHEIKQAKVAAERT